MYPYKDNNSFQPGGCLKYALVNGVRQEAVKGHTGFCPNCNSPMIAMCGKIKAHHWAHKGKRICDHWWENETQWHRDWKNYFPNEWQEIVHYDETGEKHIADIKTDLGRVIEFQHSYISLEERISRNLFYRKIIWVLDCKRLPKDEEKFLQALKLGQKIGVYNEIDPKLCKFLKDWATLGVPVFLDFGQVESDVKNNSLWLLLPKILPMLYLYECPKADFLEIFRDGNSERNEKFENFFQNWTSIIEDSKKQMRKKTEEESLNNYKRQINQNAIKRGCPKPFKDV